MTRQELIDYHVDACGAARDLMQRKSSDYASDADPFRNFRQAEALGICANELGILVRLSDKLSRLCQVVSSGKQAVLDETVNDTVLDAINYLVILSAYILDKGEVRHPEGGGDEV
jgi:hypothetical protein